MSFAVVLVLQLLTLANTVTGGFCKKEVLKNITNFTGKHQCLSLFLTKLKV